jgi:hypothetical protein
MAPSLFAIQLFMSTLLRILPNGGPAPSAKMSQSADNVPFSVKVKFVHCPSGRLIGGEIGSLDNPRSLSESTRLMSRGSSRDVIGVDEARRLR